MARRRPWGFYLTLAAIAWAAFVMSAALWYPVYASDPPAPASERTLVAVNGPWGLILMAIPVVLALVAFAGLHAKCKSGSRRGENAAVTAACLLGTLSLAGVASVGMFVFPTALLLVFATVLTPALRTS